MRNAFPLMKIRIKPCRFPTKEWKALGTFHAREERTVQSFAVGDEEMFAKYVKVNIKWRLLPLATTITHYYRPQSLRRLCFYTCLSVILFTGRVVSQHALQQVSGGCLSQHALQVFRPTPKGELEGSVPHTGGVSMPTPRGSLQAHTRGGVSRPTPGGVLQTPPANSYCGRRYACYWNAFLFCFMLFHGNIGVNSKNTHFCRSLKLHCWPA